MSSMKTDGLDSESGLEDYFPGCSGEEGMDREPGTPGTPSGKDGQMIESYDKRELIAPEGYTDAEPYEGMEFDSEDAARAFYNAYARRMGFRVRVSRSHRSMRDGTIIYRRFVCSKEGFYVHKNQVGSKRQRPITRVGCLAMLVVRRQGSGRWLVTKFHEEHNHEPVSPRKVDLKPRMTMHVRNLNNYVEVNESHLKKKLLVSGLPHGNPDLEPYEGMEFQSEEAAKLFYYSYAKDMGFTVRISKCRRARDRTILCRRFVCSKEGYYVRKYGRTKRSRALTRVGCLARLVVRKLDSGIWVVANFEKEHNHPPFSVGRELCYQSPIHRRCINRGLHASPHVLSESVSNCADIDLQNSQGLLAWRFNKLHQEGIKFAEEGASSIEIFSVAMLAWREAEKKVAAAKKNAVLVPKPANLVTASNLHEWTDQASCQNNVENHASVSNPQSSNKGRQVAAPGGVKLIQQPMNLVLITPGSQNGFGQTPLAINLPNEKAVPGGAENKLLNIAVSFSIQKQQAPCAHRLDRNGSMESSKSAGRRKKHMASEDEMKESDFFQVIGEGASTQHVKATQSQACQSASRASNGGNSTTVALSEAQLAVLHAVAEAFNVPTMGTTSASALPIRVSPVSNDLSLNGGKSCTLFRAPPVSLQMVSQHTLEAPRTPRPNPLVHAAAIAAGARIPSPDVAASIIKAVQSRTSLHVRSGDFVYKFPETVGGESPGDQHVSNIHYIRSGEQYLPPLTIEGLQGIMKPSVHQGTLTREASCGMQGSAMEELGCLSDAADNLCQDPTMMIYQEMV